MDGAKAKRSEIAAVVSTFLGQLLNLHTCLKLVKQGVDHVIVCYNVQHNEKRNLFDPKIPPEVEALADEVIYTEELGQYPGESQCTKTGLKRALEIGYPYTLKINGDVFFSKPENIPSLIDQMDGHDFLAPQWHNHFRFSSTMMFFGRTDKLYTAYNDIPLAGQDQLERRWQRAFTAHNLRYKQEPYAIERQELESPENNGMWGELLGFRHIHGRIDGQADLTG